MTATPWVRAPVTAIGLRPLARVVGGVVGVFLLANLILSWAMQGPSGSWQRAARIDPHLLLEIEARVAAAHQDVTAGALDPGALVSVVGLSTARVGLDSAEFAKALEGRGQLLNIAATGGSFQELQRYAQPLLTHGPRSRLVLVAIHPSWLAGRESASASRSLDPLWALTHRGTIHARLQAMLVQARVALLRRVELQPSSWQLRSGDPWQTGRLYQEPKASPETLAAQLRHWTEFGWFDPTRFSTANAEAKALGQLLQGLRGHAQHVVVVLLPEAAEFRSRVPMVALETTRKVVDQIDPGLRLVDLRDSLGPSAFHDLAHVNPMGRMLLGAIVADLARPYLAPPRHSEPSAGTR